MQSIIIRNNAAINTKKKTTNKNAVNLIIDSFCPEIKNK